MSPGPKSHRIHIAASPSHHSYAPAVARKLDTDAAADHASHGYVPSSVDGPKHEFEGTAPHGYIPSSETALKVGPDVGAAEGAAHGYVPAVPERGAAETTATAAVCHSLLSFLSLQLVWIVYSCTSIGAACITCQRRQGHIISEEWSSRVLPCLNGQAITQWTPLSVLA